MGFRKPAVPSLVFALEVDIAFVLDALLLKLSLLNQDAHFFFN